MAVSTLPLFVYVFGALLVSVVAQTFAPVAVPTTTTSATSTLTGIAATAPTIGPSHQVGKLPALG